MESSSNVQISNTQESLFEYDELKMYYGYTYWVTDKIQIFNN